MVLEDGAGAFDLGPGGRPSGTSRGRYYLPQPAGNRLRRRRRGMRAGRSQLSVFRAPYGPPQHPLIRLHPERWLESLVGGDVSVLDERLESASSIRRPLQGFDFWSRVQGHHGREEFPRFGYSLAASCRRKSRCCTWLRLHFTFILKSDALRRYISPEIEWEFVGMDENWRQGVREVLPKRHGARSHRGDTEEPETPEARPGAAICSNVSRAAAGRRPDLHTEARQPFHAPSRRRTSTSCARWYAL